MTCYFSVVSTRSTRNKGHSLTKENLLLRSYKFHKKINIIIRLYLLLGHLKVITKYQVKHTHTALKSKEFKVCVFQLNNRNTASINKNITLFPKIFQKMNGY